MSQEELAEILDVKQANVSKIKRREDMRLSTLVTYVRAVGGDIKIIAHFPNCGGGTRNVQASKVALRIMTSSYQIGVTDR